MTINQGSVRHTIAKRVDGGISSGALGARTREGGRNPSEGDIVRPKHAADHQEQGKVAGRDGLCGSGDDKASHTKDNRP